MAEFYMTRSSLFHSIFLLAPQDSCNDGCVVKSRHGLLRHLETGDQWAKFVQSFAHRHAGNETLGRLTFLSKWRYPHGPVFRYYGTHGRFSFSTGVIKVDVACQRAEELLPMGRLTFADMFMYEVSLRRSA